MEAAVTGAVVGGGIQSGLTAFFEYIKHANGIKKDDLNKLTESVELLSALLAKNQVNGQEVKFSSEMETVVLKANALVNELNYQLILKKFKKQKVGKVKTIIRKVSKKFSFIFKKITSKIESVIDELERILRKKALELLSRQHKRVKA